MVLALAAFSYASGSKRKGSPYLAIYVMLETMGAGVTSYCTWLPPRGSSGRLRLFEFYLNRWICCGLLSLPGYYMISCIVLT